MDLFNLVKNIKSHIKQSSTLFDTYLLFDTYFHFRFIEKILETAIKKINFCLVKKYRQKKSINGH